MQEMPSNSRIDTLDVARGIALIAMATYHFSWDLELFGFLKSGTAGSGFFKYYARAIASSFLFLVGFSLVLATRNGIQWRRFIKRLLQVGAAALAISVATYFAMPNSWIFFGILHHIVLASLIGLAFVRLHWAILILAAIAAFLLPAFGLVALKSEWLRFIGLFETLPISNDFVPLFPWLSASLTGIGAAKFSMERGWISRLSERKAAAPPARQLKFLGQHSLIFYLVHQPILLSLVWLAAQVAQPGFNSASQDFQIECKAVCTRKFSEKQCETYCNCFENELKNTQSSQLPAENQSETISGICSRIMQETING